ncbi:hypothetical protein Desaci_1242 [Desulfosporosinus acidiphilus SJ4]|uniref:HTH-like domain-containing protein n=1 Tax=Desulfosporosinus acidiphilus (strain DSM 22704 / JCM 16185 / SJ4) TaxID=646529 RepID=I4D397_DESAJ|nr:hypothetical protein [Desulfosporosinus acidiphilus]AFM40271.1 hypothetical protein Desaci_1242 [Desulfosporosinus acidiphilus SJ4]
MTENELGKILREMYDNAPAGDKVANVHLFGVKYASILLENDINLKEIINASGLKPSYVTEISNGIKLSKYVILKC